MWHEIEIDGRIMRVWVTGLRVFGPASGDESPAWAFEYELEIQDSGTGAWVPHQQELSEEISESGVLQKVLTDWLAREAEAQRGL